MLRLLRCYPGVLPLSLILFPERVTFGVWCQRWLGYIFTAGIFAVDLVHYKVY